MAEAATRAEALLVAVCERLLASEAEFNALDRAIGDGDHGHNLSRAANRLLELRGDLFGQPMSEAMLSAGKEVVMSVGGASGPLYGTLLLEIGKVLPLEPGLADWAEAFSAGVEGVARRGRSAEGQKTMLDVLAPAARALAENSDAGVPAALSAMREAAEAGFAAQRPLRAEKGRAAFVGERSIGEDDPGAASSLLCLSIIAANFEEISS